MKKIKDILFIILLLAIIGCYVLILIPKKEEAKLSEYLIAWTDCGVINYADGCANYIDLEYTNLTAKKMLAVVIIYRLMEQNTGFYLGHASGIARNVEGGETVSMRIQSNFLDYAPPIIYAELENIYIKY